MSIERLSHITYYQTFFYNMHAISARCLRTLHAQQKCMFSSSLFDVTPLKRSLNNDKIYFKMDNLQPSGSFKDRGISHMIQTIASTNIISKLVCSSGGNAGHAVATAGEKLRLPVDVFVPVTTMPMMVEKIQRRGANVIVDGANWNEADTQARKALVEDPNAQYIPPFDHPLIWEGMASSLSIQYSC